MSKNVNGYDRPWEPEMYDQHQTQTEDVDFIRQPLAKRRGIPKPDLTKEATLAAHCSN